MSTGAAPRQCAPEAARPSGQAAPYRTPSRWRRAPQAAAPRPTSGGRPAFTLRPCTTNASGHSSSSFLPIARGSVPAAPLLAGGSELLVSACGSRASPSCSSPSLCSRPLSSPNPAPPHRPRRRRWWPGANLDVSSPTAAAGRHHPHARWLRLLAVARLLRSDRGGTEHDRNTRNSRAGKMFCLTEPGLWIIGGSLQDIRLLVGG